MAESPKAGKLGEPFTLITTLGRALLNEALPADYPFVNDQVDKKLLGATVNRLAERYSKVEVAETLDELKALGFRWATRSGVTISILRRRRTASQGRASRFGGGKGKQGAAAVRARPNHRL